MIKRTFFTPLLILSTLLTVLNHPSAVRSEQASGDKLTLTFGLYTAVKPTEQIKKFTPVMKALQESMSASLNRPVEITFKVAASYQDGLKDIVEGKVDFSRLGPATYIEATNLDAKLPLLAVESKKGSTTDFGVICVKEDSSIKGVADLKGKKFAFGDEASTIGRYLSQQYLLENGLHASDLTKYEYLGRHDAVAAAVGAGVYDAGAVKEETFKKLKAAGTPLRELARFPNASQAWVASSELSSETLTALQNSLLSLKDESALKAIDADQMVRGHDSDFKLVREAMASNPQFFSKQ